jgi:hypothetical protein
MYGFVKNERNIDKDEEEALKKLAVHFLSLTEYALGKGERTGELGATTRWSAFWPSVSAVHP